MSLLHVVEVRRLVLGVRLPFVGRGRLKNPMNEVEGEENVWRIMFCVKWFEVEILLSERAIASAS